MAISTVSICDGSDDGSVTRQVDGIHNNLEDRFQSTTGSPQREPVGLTDSETTIVNQRVLTPH